MGILSTAQDSKKKPENPDSVPENGIPVCETSGGDSDDCGQVPSTSERLDEITASDMTLSLWKWPTASLEGDQEEWKAG